MSLKKLSSGIYIDPYRVDYFNPVDRDDSYGEALVGGNWHVFRPDDLDELTALLDARVEADAKDDAEWAEYEAKRAAKEANPVITLDLAVPADGLCPKDMTVAESTSRGFATDPTGPPMPTIRRIVNYVTGTNFSVPGSIRPAIIVRVWSDTCVQLQVFTDGENDGLPNVVWKTSVLLDPEGKTLGTWHWPESGDFAGQSPAKYVQ